MDRTWGFIKKLKKNKEEKPVNVFKAKKTRLKIDVALVQWLNWIYYCHILSTLIISFLYTVKKCKQYFFLTNYSIKFFDTKIK